MTSRFQRSRIAFSVLGAVALGLLSFAPTVRVAAQQTPGLSANATVFVSGLDQPRGLRFGTTGLTGRAATDLYVAEAGEGGSLDTWSLPLTSFGRCLPPKPNWPHFLGGYTGRISMINAAGRRTTIVDNLPSGMTGGLGIGPADVEIMNGVLYGLLVAGCDNGNRDVPSGIIQVANDGSWSIFDLSTWSQQHPPAHPDPEDNAPDGSWYSMTQANGKLYTVNPNGGQMVELTPSSAQMREVTDISASSSSWVGPTGITYHDGAFYAVTLGTFPQQPGEQKVLKITPDGTVTTYATGLTGALGIAFDAAGQMYVLENFTGVSQPGPSAAGTGQVVRVTPGAAPQTVASGLTFPTAMTFGPDGMLYVSNLGYGLPGQGQIVRIDVNAGP